jgi:hypothetical protein
MRHSEKNSNQEMSFSEGEPSPRLADDQFYRALASHERRRVLYYLLEETDSTVEGLATVLSGWEATTTGTMQTPENRSRHLIRLKHNHLPRLADAGLIEYTPQTGAVRLDSPHPQVAAIIRQSIRAGQPDSS